MKSFLSLIAVFAFATVWADETKPVVTSPQGAVTVASKGMDVRSILHDLFTQSNKNYVLEGEARNPLYLNLKDVDFEEALQIICKLGTLEYQQQNGIYYVTKKKAPPAVKTPADPTNEQKTTDQKPTEQRPVAQEPAKPKGQLSPSVLARKLTTRLGKTDLRKVFDAFAKQTNVAIEIDPAVPDWKLDAFLINTSLKFALDTITKAAGLEYRFTDEQSIVIRMPAAEANRVTVFKDPDPVHSGSKTSGS